MAKPNGEATHFLFDDLEKDHEKNKEEDQAASLSKQAPAEGSPIEIYEKTSKKTAREVNRNDYSYDAID